MSPEVLRSVVIVGGGTAGWLAAVLARGRLDPRTGVAVVVSDETEPIGVGEGTTGFFADAMLDPRSGIDEADFLENARATLKLGIRHCGWRADGASFWGPIDDPYRHLGELARLDVPILEASFCAVGRPVSDAYLHSRLMVACKGPLLAVDGERVLSRSYAYHFDAARAGAFLERSAVGRGVERIAGHVVAAERAEDGSVTALVLRDGRRVEGAFFIDCSGVARVVRGRDAAFVRYDDVLPVDAAVVAQVAHRPGPLPPFTRAIALRSGWAWEIPTADRLGVGYVHASAFVGSEEAANEMRDALGIGDVPVRHLRFTSGRLAEPWLGNCVAVGLAAGFLEPLEATSLHATLIELELLLDALAHGRHLEPREHARFNAVFGDAMDAFRDFILLHYRGGRSDTPFWRAMTRRATNTRVDDWVARWAHAFPRRRDVVTASGTIGLNLLFPIADGLGLLDPATARRAVSQAMGDITPEVVAARHAAITSRLAEEALDHAEALRILRRAGGGVSASRIGAISNKY
ncbi:tryptophan 7-halogenase [Salinarimonas sp. NSM]|uniref:tryptophan 7-halogenase n=1 Tax=Salinarimonas sp. NSM TaxID=3458003 RepID=UPI004036C6B2